MYNLYAWFASRAFKAKDCLLAAPISTSGSHLLTLLAARIDPASFAISVASFDGLLGSCIDLFELIRLGRAFERDYQSSMLRIDVARARFHRWLESVSPPNSHSSDSLCLDDLTASERQKKSTTSWKIWRRHFRKRRTPHADFGTVRNIRMSSRSAPRMTRV